MSDTPLSFGTRLWFAWLCFFRVLFDGRFAADVWIVRQGLPAAPPTRSAPSTPPAAPLERGDQGPALQLLSLFQREGRFVDFLEQDITAFPDSDVGAAARVVHEGCRKALHAHAQLVPVRDEEEGTRVTLPAGFDAADVKLSGNVAGAGPYSGVLRHRGWRAVDLTLPTPVDGHDARVLAPAEVEL